MRAAVICLLLLALPLLAHSQGAVRREPTYKLRGSGLVITPSRESIALAFHDGVTISGAGFTLTAPELRVNVQPNELISTGQLRLPEIPEDQAPSVIESPSAAAREMARELKLPEPTFSPSALQRMEASGGIVATAEGVTLRTPSLVSTDGGRSWLAEGRTQLTRQARGEDYQLTAGTLLYDTEQQRAVARGGVTAVIRQGGDPDIRLSADSLTFGIESGELQLGGNLRIAYGDFVVTSSPLSANVRSQTATGGQASATGPGGVRASVGQVGVNLNEQSLAASGGVTISDEKNKLQVTAATVGANLKSQQLEAGGGVTLSDSARGVEVSAGSVSVSLKTRTLVASGEPTVKFGGSTFTGEKITVRQEQGKTVVEVEGEQRAKIDPGDVEKLTD